MSLDNTQNKLNSQGIYHFWKNEGETLSVMMNRFKKEYQISDDRKMTYAGRLDPMASGIVPILLDMARFKKDSYLNKDKTYEVQVMLGVKTDTLDMLGLVTSSSDVSVFEDDVIKRAVESVSYIRELAYPMYSSRPVEGKPLFMHAREGNKEIEVPIKKVYIRSIKLLNIERRKIEDCVYETIPIIESVEGDFRQYEISNCWRKFLTKNKNKEVVIITFQTDVSSGTYMRSLAEYLGEQLRVPALAYRIKRIAIKK